MPAAELVGERFGKLTVEFLLEKRSSSADRRWQSRCECGGIAQSTTHSLRSGQTTSCGCHRKAVGRLNLNSTGTRLEQRRARRQRKTTAIYEPALKHLQVSQAKFMYRMQILMERHDIAHSFSQPAPIVVSSWFQQAA